jgi:pimeloyl-ACP methyl ester carboxylesterase
MPGLFPIIYVRGFAGDASGIDKVVDDPLYGFNVGSTHVRISGDGDPVFYQFEGPLLRLVNDMGYRLFVHGDQDTFLDAQEDGTVPAASLWIHRFYDRSASTWGREPRPFDVEEAAADLLRVIDKVRAKTGAPKVHLVAHSMGGLICRSMIQRLIPDLREDPEVPEEQRPARARDFVDSLFTYGTPHGGIRFDLGLGLLENLRDEFNLGGGDIFGRERMYEYLTPASRRQEEVPDSWDARDNADEENFPASRIFCLVGTNAEDYSVARGWSSRAVGVKSDGLVQVENAMVTGANHAYVHRSHSGRFGLVNSEEGYQNLVRFLFGDVRVTADLVDLRLPDDEELTWQAEAWVSIRDLPVLMHAQKASHHCPILIERPPSADPGDRPIPLITSYLWSHKAHGQNRMRYTINLRLVSLREHDHVFFWNDHTEGSADFDDYLVVDVALAEQGGLCAWAAWGSEIPVPLRNYEASGPPLTDQDDTAGTWCVRIGLPRCGEFLGDRAAVKLEVRPA